MFPRVDPGVGTVHIEQSSFHREFARDVLGLSFGDGLKADEFGEGRPEEDRGQGIAAILRHVGRFVRQDHVDKVLRPDEVTIPQVGNGLDDIQVDQDPIASQLHLAEQCSRQGGRLDLLPLTQRARLQLGQSPRRANDRLFEHHPTHLRVADHQRLGIVAEWPTENGLDLGLKFAQSGRELLARSQGSGALRLRPDRSRVRPEQD